jgi:fructoselysine-6-P-deglycase FrlB-like protein
MARPYATEMAKLSETFDWAANADIVTLRQAVRTAGLSPVRAIGSGGSLTAAHALAAFHQQYCGRIAAVATPLEAVNEPLESSISHWLLSAGGGNVDILAAANALIQREPRQLAILCGREDSPLAVLGQTHAFTDLLIFPLPAGKDGFLATNSLLGFITLLARAYAAEFAAADPRRSATEIVQKALDSSSDTVATWEAEITPLWSRPTTLLLYGPSTRVGAVDLESKFTEAALGNLQLADYRNFAHGRHHWLAKRGEISGVLAFITDADRALAERTLDLIPGDIPQARLFLPGDQTATVLLSLVASLRICGWAGAARGIDPGRPGVPDFGRKLYNLPLPRSRAGDASAPYSRDRAAIARKAGRSVKHLAAGELARWQAALDAFRGRLRDARFGGIVFDYDGTVVDTRDRFRPPADRMRAELIRLLDTGSRMAVATGRGTSVRRDLQACLPPSLWSRILIGYYNGAEVAPLDDDGAPDGRDVPCKQIASLAAALRAQSELAESARQTDRPYQITLEAARVLPESRLWDLAHQVILMIGANNVSVTRSSHSIDIVANGVSKLNVIARLRDHVGVAPLLTIGDRGRWPGNDYQLLREPYSLGVDEISVDPETCWNLAKPGQRGPAATLDYLQALEGADGGLRFRTGSLQ